MATNFPGSLDNLINPAPGNATINPSHSSQHADANDAIEAIQAKIGIDNSAVTTSIDYKIRNLDASAITTGTLASARLSGSYTGITGVGTLTAGSIPATLLTGTIASARISGSYTGITAIGTLTSLTVDGASSPSVSIKDWTPDGAWTAIEGYNGYLLMGNTSNRSIYLRTNTAGTNVYIGGNGNNVVTVGDTNVSMSGTLYTNLVYGGNSYMNSSWVYSSGGSGQYLGATSQTLLTGTNNNGGLYFGGNTGASSTGGIEASWQNAAMPSIVIGVTRDNNRTMSLYEYNSTITHYCGNTARMRYQLSGVGYGSYGSFTIWGSNGGYHGISCPDIAQAVMWSDAYSGIFGHYRNNSSWNFYVLNGTYNSSDERWKRNIEPLEYGMNLLREIEPKTFLRLTENENDDPEAVLEETHYGFTTQNVFAALEAVGEQRKTNVVSVGGPDMPDMAYPDRQYLNAEALIAPIVKAIKEIDDRLQTLENK